MTRPTILSIDLGAIRSNVELARSCAPEANMLACVKADAYGHGIVPVSNAIADKVDALGVANLDEAICLRSQGVDKPILLLEGVFDKSELEEVRANDFWAVVHSPHQLEMLSSLNSESSVVVWLKMDSGMHRLGFSPSNYVNAYKNLLKIGAVREIIHMTHFACADELKNKFTAIQIDEFNNAVGDIAGQRSLANSAAILAWPDSHMDWVRPGFMLYGASPFPEPHLQADQLVPVMELISEVIAIREVSAGEGVGYGHSWRATCDSLIAVVAVGYGDGYPRNTAVGTPVLVGGHRATTVGHVAMDMMLVDVTGLTNVSVGDAVELWGRNLSITEVAASSGYSPYELMTRLTGRVKRIYLNS